jgi:hypothetical protein
LSWNVISDDISLSYFSQSPYTCTIEDVINSDLESISIWSKQWLVNFNPQKTKAGTPAFVFTKGDLELFINTHCFLLEI